MVREGGGEEGEVGGGVESQDAETSEQPWKAVRSVVQKHFILRTIKVCLIKASLHYKMFPSSDLYLYR